MDRSPKSGGSGSGLGRGMFWGSQASSAAMQFAIPPGIGYWIDLRYGTKPVGVIVGAVFGFISGFMALLRLVKMMERVETSSDRDRTESDEPPKSAN